MKLATFAVNGRARVGAVTADDTAVVDLAAADAQLAVAEKRSPHACFASMIDLLEAGPAGLAAAARAADHGEAATYHLVAVELQAPVMPRKLLCLAGNYADHIEKDGKQRLAIQDTQTPRPFMKPPTTTVVGPGAPILIPPIGQSIDWEGELAVVMGRRCKGVAAADALQYVAGYTVMNDVSERNLKIRDRTESRPRDEWFDWLNGKWFDNSAPLGPWIVTTDEITDPQTLDIHTYVNGEVKQHNTTAAMIFPVADLIEYISAMLTLEPGDVISTGTISGVGMATGSYLKAGDNVKVTISRIGGLDNTVVLG